MKKKIIIIISIALLIILGSVFIVFYQKDKANSNFIELNKKTLQEKINNKDDFILVITREGCSHCAEYIPVFTRVLKDYDLKAYYIDIAKLSSDDKSYLDDLFTISGTPTTLFINKGEEKTVINRIVGSTSRKKIEDRLKKLKYIE